ncbi:MAG: hypothetical protein IJK84_02130 [Bacteroidales bacterium]|nr:hypothetical protein [Bacteroidales bacterium]
MTFTVPNAQRPKWMEHPSFNCTVDEVILRYGNAAISLIKEACYRRRETFGIIQRG